MCHARRFLDDTTSGLISVLICRKWFIPSLLRLDADRSTFLNRGSATSADIKTVFIVTLIDFLELARVVAALMLPDSDP